MTRVAKRGWYCVDQKVRPNHDSFNIVTPVSVDRGVCGDDHCLDQILADILVREMRCTY